MKSLNRSDAKQQQWLPIPLPTTPSPARRPGPRPCTQERADWWFRQMRRVVDEGLDFRSPGVF